MAAIKNSSVVLPIEYGREIIRGVLGRSKVLELGRRIPNMRGETYKSKEIKNKPLSVLAFEGVNLEAEEIAVIIPIAINTLEDVENFGIELSTEISEQVVGAFQEVIDSAVLFGKDTPWTSATNLDAGLVAAAADAGAVVVWNGTIYFGCDRKHVERCFDVIRRELKTFKTKELTTRALADAKRQYIGQLTIGRENSETLSIASGKSLLRYNRCSTLADTIKKIEAITAKDIIECANTVYSDQNLSTLVLS